MSESGVKPWCDKCKLEEPISLDDLGGWLVRQRRWSKCRGYVPPGKTLAYDQSEICRLPVRSTKAEAIADWELATGREWPWKGER